MAVSHTGELDEDLCTCSSATPGDAPSFLLLFNHCDSSSVAVASTMAYAGAWRKGAMSLSAAVLGTGIGLCGSPGADQQELPGILHPAPGITSLRVGSAFAEIYDHGAHVTRYYSRSADEPILFLSKKAILDGSKAIRGGIPLIFPQFGPNGPLPSHGFARTMKWTIERENSTGNTVEVAYRLRSDEATMKIWPHEFSSLYTVRLKENQLECDWEVENTSNEPFIFTAALHSYFQISNIATATLHDFSGLKYIDTADEGKLCSSTGRVVKIEGEVDRVYIQAPNRLQISDKDDSIVIIKDNSLPDAVVWNPAEEKAKGMKDFETDEYKQMVCVEPAAVNEPVVLIPGDKFTTRLIISKQPQIAHTMTKPVHESPPDEPSVIFHKT